MFNKKYRFNNLIKDFSFSGVIKDTIPGYIRHYVLNDEKIIVSYKTARDHAIFTNSKLVIFDTYDTHKEIITIPYQNVKIITILFDTIDAELNLYLEYDSPLKLKFIDLEAEDKVRLRLLYTYISRIISHDDIPKDIYNRLIADDVELKNSKN